MENPKQTSTQANAKNPRQAAVTLTEFGDYECPHCARAFPVIQKIREELGHRLIFEFKNFPLTELHPHAQMAAEAAESARAQGHFEEMHDLLFEHQSRLSAQAIARLAEQAGLELEVFAADWSSHRFAGKVEKDVNEGLKLGVQGTPTFFVNGELFDEPWNYDGLMAALKAELRI